MKVAGFASLSFALVLASCTAPSPVGSNEERPIRTEVPANKEPPDRTGVPSSEEPTDRKEELRRKFGDGDGWLQRGYRDLFRGYPRELPKEKAATVTYEFEAEAERRLESVAWARIESAEADAFVGRKLSIGPGETAVLLRGVAWEYTLGSTRERGDKLRVRWKDGVVVVLQIGSRDADAHPRIVRRAAVAVLPGEPTDVYPDGMVSYFGSVPPPR